MILNNNYSPFQKDSDNLIRSQETEKRSSVEGFPESYVPAHVLARNAHKSVVDIEIRQIHNRRKRRARTLRHSQGLGELQLDCVAGQVELEDRLDEIEADRSGSSWSRMMKNKGN